MLYRQGFAKDWPAIQDCAEEREDTIPGGLMDACDLPKEAARSGGDTC